MDQNLIFWEIQPTFACGVRIKVTFNSSRWNLFVLLAVVPTLLYCLYQVYLFLGVYLRVIRASEAWDFWLKMFLSPLKACSSIIYLVL